VISGVQHRPRCQRVAPHSAYAQEKLQSDTTPQRHRAMPTATHLLPANTAVGFDACPPTNRTEKCSLMARETRRSAPRACIAQHTAITNTASGVQSLASNPGRAPAQHRGRLRQLVQNTEGTEGSDNTGERLLEPAIQHQGFLKHPSGTMSLYSNTTGCLNIALGSLAGPLPHYRQLEHRHRHEGAVGESQHHSDRRLRTPGPAPTSGIFGANVGQAAVKSSSTMPANSAR